MLRVWPRTMFPSEQNLSAHARCARLHLLASFGTTENKGHVPDWRRNFESAWCHDATNQPPAACGTEMTQWKSERIGNTIRRTLPPAFFGSNLIYCLRRHHWLSRRSRQQKREFLTIRLVNLMNRCNEYCATLQHCLEAQVSKCLLLPILGHILQFLDGWVRPLRPQD